MYKFTFYYLCHVHISPISSVPSCLVVGALALLQGIEIELARPSVAGIGLETAHESLVVERTGALGRLCTLHGHVHGLLLRLLVLSTSQYTAYCLAGNAASCAEGESLDHGGHEPTSRALLGSGRCRGTAFGSWSCGGWCSSCWCLFVQGGEVERGKDARNMQQKWEVKVEREELVREDHPSCIAYMPWQHVCKLW